MKLVRYNSGWPFNLFDDFFNDDFFNWNFNLGNYGMKTDIKENDNEYEFSIELPGLNKEDINVSFEDGYLVVSAKREKSEDEKNDKYLRSERSYGQYSRKFYVGEIDEQKISAKYENGILKLSLPKDEIEKVEAKKYITIE